jgi:hypothetical protein
MIEAATNPRKISIDFGLCRDCQTCTLACSLYHAGECNLGLDDVAVELSERCRERVFA